MTYEEDRLTYLMISYISLIVMMFIMVINKEPPVVITLLMLTWFYVAFKTKEETIKI